MEVIIAKLYSSSAFFHVFMYILFYEYSCAYEVFLETNMMILPVLHGCISKEATLRMQNLMPVQPKYW